MKYIGEDQLPCGFSYGQLKWNKLEKKLRTDKWAAFTSDEFLTILESKANRNSNSLTSLFCSKKPKAAGIKVKQRLLNGKRLWYLKIEMNQNKPAESVVGQTKEG